MNRKKILPYLKKFGIGTILFFTVKGLITTSLIILGVMGLSSID